MRENCIGSTILAITPLHSLKIYTRVQENKATLFGSFLSSQKRIEPGRTLLGP